jgi:hypothetical protein
LVVTVAAVAYAAGQAKAAAPVQAVVRAQKFELVDRNGKERTVLALMDGQPVLALLDEKGLWRAALSLDSDGSPRLGLLDEKGKIRADLSLNPDGRPRLGLLDEKGKIRADLSLSPDHGPDLNLLDEKGKIRAALMLDSDGGPGLGMFDGKGQTRAALGAAPLEAIDTGAVGNRTEFLLVLFDRDGKVVWQAP